MQSLNWSQCEDSGQSGGQTVHWCVCVCFFLQRGSAIWAEESDGAKVKAEPSRDFAKVSTFCRCVSTSLTLSHTNICHCLFLTYSFMNLIMTHNGRSFLMTSSSLCRNEVRFYKMLLFYLGEIFVMSTLNRHSGGVTLHCKWTQQTLV